MTVSSLFTLNIGPSWMFMLGGCESQRRHIRTAGFYFCPLFSYVSEHQPHISVALLIEGFCPFGNANHCVTQNSFHFVLLLLQVVPSNILRQSTGFIKYP